MSSSEGRFRICVVCTGNICRSPMGEYLLREAFEDAGLSAVVVVDSAGTSAEEAGRPMDRRTANALLRHGARDLGWHEHRARQFRPAWFDDVDLVLAADHGHARQLTRVARTPEEAARIRLLRSFDPESVAQGTLGMDDPWYGGDRDFDTTYAEVQAAVPGIVAYVRSQLGT